MTKIINEIFKMVKIGENNKEQPIWVSGFFKCH